MKYRHPIEIPKSNIVFDWIGDRIPVSDLRTRGDTYPVTWASDDLLYTSSGDPCWFMRDGEPVIVDPNKVTDTIETARLAHGLSIERFIGDAENYTIERVNDMPRFIGGGGSGPKPCGIISVNGKLYFAAQNMLGWKKPLYREKSQHGSDATIIMSEDFGKTWTPDLTGVLGILELNHYTRDVVAKPGWEIAPDDINAARDWQPMFPDSLFGGPSFVQFGKNNSDCIDDYVYAVSGDQWDNGKNLRLGRVRSDMILDKNSWEFLSGLHDGKPSWNTEIESSVPILSIDKHISLPEMVFIKSISKFLLLTWAFHNDFNSKTGSELTILESDAPWGPYSLIHYEWMWHNSSICAYTPRIPLKWFNQELLEGYVLHSGNWEDFLPYYMPHIKKFKLKIRE